MRNDYQKEIETIHAPESLKASVKARMREEEKLIQKGSAGEPKKKFVQWYFPVVGAAAILLCVAAGGQFLGMSGRENATGSYAAAEEEEMMAEAAAEEAEGAFMAEAAEEEEMMAEAEAVPAEEEGAATIETESSTGQNIAPGLLAGETEKGGKLVSLEEFDASFGTRFAQLEVSSVVAHINEGEYSTGSLVFSYTKEGSLFSVAYSVGEQNVRDRETEEEKTIEEHKIGFSWQDGQGYALWIENESSLVISWETAKVTDEALVEEVVREVLGKM
ncbi:MAG: hypothetical protein IJP31_04260 [Lachnospiraceae bacterium]|nr:hypothetical protein [Lachnospiraceae bacterium]